MNTCYTGCFSPVTHYFDKVNGGKSYLCQYHADQFGYPQYLVPLTPAPWRKEYGYLVNSLAGDGQSDPVLDLWPFEEDHAESVLSMVGCQDPYLLADAAWRPYEAHLSENAGLTFEVTRVTVLPLVGV